MVECAEIVALVLGLVEGCPLDNFGARRRPTMLYGPVDHNKQTIGSGERARERQRQVFQACLKAHIHFTLYVVHVVQEYICFVQLLINCFNAKLPLKFDSNLLTTFGNKLPIDIRPSSLPSCPIRTAVYCRILCSPLDRIRFKQCPQNAKASKLFYSLGD